MSTQYIGFFMAAALLAALSLSSPQQCSAGPQADRFFLMGSGVLSLHNLRNGRAARVQLLNGDRSLNEKALAEVDRVFGFPTAEKEEHISPRLLFMLSYFADRAAPGKTIQIESGYRSPEYNNTIRDKGANAAKTSAHIDGMALDFWLEGVDGKQLWETVRAKNCCGVGHYGGKTIHLDAGRPRFWEAATSGTKVREPDNNRHIYLATDFDRYGRGETIRLALSGISTFGFGVKPTAQLFSPTDSTKPIARMPIHANNTTDCIRIKDHKTSRFLPAPLPPGLPAGRYTVKMEFCERPFAQMPTEAVSNEIELTL